MHALQVLYQDLRGNLVNDLNSTIFFLLRIGVLHIRNGSLECALEQLILRRVSHKRPRDEPVHHIPRLDSD